MPNTCKVLISGLIIALVVSMLSGCSGSGASPAAPGNVDTSSSGGAGGNGGSGGTSSSTFTIGGTVSGLSGTLALQNNGGDDLILTNNGSFTFKAALAEASTYLVTVKTQPTDQTCTVTNGSGTANGANLTDIVVSCAAAVVNISTGGVGTLTVSGPVGIGKIHTLIQVGKTLYVGAKFVYSLDTSAPNNGLSVLGKGWPKSTWSQVYSFAVVGNTLYAAANASIYRLDTTNPGNGWTEFKVLHANGLSYIPMYQTDIHPNIFAAIGTTLYVAGMSCSQGDPVRSLDTTKEDSTWIKVTSKGLTSNCLTMTSLSAIGTTLYATGWDGVYKLETTQPDSGWVVIPNKGIPVMLLNGSPVLNPVTSAAIGTRLYAELRTLYASYAVFSFDTLNPGNGWTQISGIGNPISLTTNGTTLYAGEGYLPGGVWSLDTTNPNNYWTNNGLAGSTVNFVAAAGTTLYAGKDSGEIWSMDTTDPNKAWVMISNGLTGTAVNFVVAVETTLYAGENSGGVWSMNVIDPNKAWAQILKGWSNNAAASNSTIVVGTTIYAGIKGGFYTLDTTNLSNGWISVSKNWPINFTASSVVSMGTALYAGINGGGVWVLDTTNLAKGWTQIPNNGLVNPKIYSLAVKDATLYCGTDTTVFSFDTTHPNNGWSQITSNGLVNPNNTGYYVAAVDSTLYAGTSPDGVFSYDTTKPNNGWTVNTDGKGKDALTTTITVQGVTPVITKVFCNTVPYCALAF